MAAPQAEAAGLGPALPEAAIPRAEVPQPDRQVLHGSSTCRGWGPALENG
jgi:hypothetical protein